MGLPETFNSLSDPIRRSILILLRRGRLSAGEVSKELNISPAALSYHLKMLKKSDLVIEYKVKNFIYYELNTTVFQELIIWFEQFSENSVSNFADNTNNRCK